MARDQRGRRRTRPPEWTPAPKAKKRGVGRRASGASSERAGQVERRRRKRERESARGEEKEVESRGVKRTRRDVRKDLIP